MEVKGAKGLILPDGEAAFNHLYAHYQRVARNSGREWRLAEEEFRRLTKGDCHYCGAPPGNSYSLYGGTGDYEYSGIDRIDNSRGYVSDNVVPCCRVCNVAKGTMRTTEFLGWIRRVFDHSVRSETK